jgi:Flp pilus assembly protein TadD
VAERKDVLSGLFFVLTIGAYARYARSPQSVARYGLVMLLFALGLLCKPMLVTLPVVLLLLDYWPLQRPGSFRQLALEKVPLLVLSAASCVATYLGPTDAMLAAGSYTLPHRLANAVMNSKVYLDQMLYPAGLTVFYPVQIDPPAGRVALAGAVVAAISVAVWRMRRRQPWLLTGWLWYLVMLLPVAGIVQVGVFAHADRYTYLPEIGIYFMLTWMAAEWRVPRVVLGAAMAGIVALLALCAWKQTARWRDSEALWNHALACTTDNYVAHLNLGKFLLEKGDVDDATAHFREVLRIKPRYADAHYDLGIALMQQEKWDAAVAEFQQALMIDPASANAHNNLGNILCRTGRLDEGMAHFEQALKINPRSEQAHSNFGNALFFKGRLDEAIAQYQIALQLNPANPQTRQGLERALAQKSAGERH